jgi:hypothetical protein
MNVKLSEKHKDLIEIYLFIKIFIQNKKKNDACNKQKRISYKLLLEKK